MPPVRGLVGVEGDPDAPHPLRQRDETGLLDRGTDRLRWEGSKAAPQRMGTGEVLLAEQGGWQGLIELVEVLGATTAPLGQHEPEEGQHQRGDAARKWGEDPLQPERLGVGQELRQGGKIGGERRRAGCR